MNRLAPRVFSTLLSLTFLIAAPSVLSKPSLSEAEANWLKQNPAIRVAFDGNFPPYSFVNEQGKLEGFSVDVFELIAQQLDTKIARHGETQWQNILALGKNAEVDAIATMVERPERLQWFQFTQPYVHKSLVLITESANPHQLQSVADLKQHRVALVKDYQYSDRLLADVPSITPIWVDDTLAALNAVATQKADATVSYIGAAHFYRTRYLISNLTFVDVYDAQQSPERIAVPNSAAPLASAISKALANIPESQLQTLREKWLPTDQETIFTKVKLTQEEKDWIKHHPSIRMAVDPEFAPFEYVVDGQHKGITSDYVALLKKRLNLNIEIAANLSWNQAVELAKRQEIDLLAALGKNHAREEYLLFSEPYLNFHRVVITEKNHPYVGSIRDLVGKRIGVQANTSHYGYVIEYTSIKPIVYNSLQESLLALSGGEIDAFIGNVSASTYWMRKLNLTNLRVAAPISRETQNLHFAVRKDWPILQSIINKGLASISEPERINISEKWMNIEYRFDTDYQRIIQVVAVLLFLLLLFLAWNLLLKRAIAAQKKKLLHYTHHDQITNLPNRFLMMDRLHQLIDNRKEEHGRLALISINLDNFKDINDGFGHQTGDRVLAACAGRFTDELAQGEIIGRLGGDQFLVILPELNETAYAAIKSTALINSLNDVIEIKEHEINLNARAGIAVFPEDGRTADELLKAADLATHHAREKGRGKFSFYTTKLNDDISRKMLIEKHISTALAGNELYLAYQPKFCLKTKRIKSFEALMRWESPVLGNVSPAEFIPILEQGGLIQEIGLFALGEAMQTLKEWQTLYDPTLTMAVNLSPKQFQDTNLVNRIQSIIERIGIDPASLELEITEGLLLKHNPEIQAMFNKLKKMRIQLSLDDFGTGYASMRYLKHYHFDTLKIDRAFVCDLESSDSSESIVSAIIAMSHRLDMAVVAEGVENAGQLDQLVKMQCDYVQGWLLAKAERKSETDKILAGDYMAPEQASCLWHQPT